MLVGEKGLVSVLVKQIRVFVSFSKVADEIHKNKSYEST